LGILGSALWPELQQIDRLSHGKNDNFGRRQQDWVPAKKRKSSTEPPAKVSLKRYC